MQISATLLPKRKSSTIVET